MDPELSEALGIAADRVDNLLSAEQLPFPEPTAKQARRESLESLRDELRRIYIEVTGENPWEV